MANEYLKRQPTSSGNSRRWTVSFWMKNSDPAQGYTAIMGAGQVSPTNVYNELFYTGSQIGFDIDNSSDPESYFITAAPLLRDPSAWMHVVLSFTDQGDNANTRVKFYINGAFVDNNTTTALDIDETTFWNNVNYIQYIGSRAQQDAGSNTFNAQYTDIFLVDGQALTPDVFGFYKEGDGYVSAGSTLSTDFKPGQWVPKRPRIIKTEIERRGGFGVNGFYLPMNDSSNAGADFHCTPNSIITLKGEDLPQPRNGAPTTSDAYVSQLRSDPYAANLVLAVPGISTSTGINTVTNGHFDSDVSGWTAVDATLTWSNGRAQTNRTGGSGYTAYQEITVESGKRYTVSGVTDSTGGGNRQDIRILDTLATNSPTIIASISGTNNEVVQGSSSFTASQTTYYVYFVSDTTGTGFFDNIVVKQEDAPRDYSADIKGSGSNKTLTPGGNAGVGYELGGYYGSAMPFNRAGYPYFSIPDQSDFEFGSDDFTLECWVYLNNSTQQYEGILSKPGSSDQNGILFYKEQANNNITFLATIGANNWNVLLTFGASTQLQKQWNHYAVVRDGNNFTAYLNGVAVAVDTDSGSIINNSGNFEIGRYAVFPGSISYGFDGYIQDLRVYKGVAKYKGGFDVPKPYTPVGFEGDSWRTVADCTANNFATLNPLQSFDNPSYGSDNTTTLSNGNLTATKTAASSNEPTPNTIPFPVNGKFYYEVYLQEFTSTGPHIGVCLTNGIIPSSFGYSVSGSAIYISAYDTTITLGASANTNGSGSTTELSSTQISEGDIVSVAVDLTSTRRITFYINGTEVGYAENFDETEFLSYLQSEGGNNSYTAHWNFGQNPSFSGTLTAGTNADDSGKGLFKYAPPSGFLALCEDNLPAPAVADPGEHFKTVLYTGDGNNGRSITGIGFQPDFVWMKDRDAFNYHILVDSVRGPNRALFSNVTSAENLGVSIDSLQSFDNDGFSLSLDPTAASHSGWNASGNNLVAWCWKAGGPAVSNTDGSITSQVSANQDAGFSIVSYTGTGSAGTIGHGLGATPKMIIIKNRGDVSGNTRNWIVYHSANGATQYVRLNDTNNAATLSTVFNDTEPTSSVFSVGNSVAVSESGDGHIAYCWAEIEGFSKFGSYAGNGDADGPFVYCGFKPAWVMIKRTDVANNWFLHDSARTSTNPSNFYVMPDQSNAEQSFDVIDFLSNGFKLRNVGGGGYNGSGGTYIFAAFAESPFKTANAK